jgi:DNA ligase (NAD+)
MLRIPADLFQLVADKDGKEAQNNVFLRVMYRAFIFTLVRILTGSNSSQRLLSEIAELPGWGQKSATKLANAASGISTRGISLERFIYSLGIRHVGRHNSKLIASAYGNVDAFLSALKNFSDKDKSTFNALAGSNETEGTKGIGAAQISSLTSFASEVQSVKAARELANAIPVRDEITISSAIETSDTRPWQGYTVVFTGSLPNNLSRAKAQELARQLGSTATPGTVSKSTDVVVAGEKGGKKLARAKELGVRIVEADEFVKIVEE